MVSGSVETYLLNAIFVALLQRQDFVRSLLSVVDLFPSLLLLLLKQGDSVREQLGITLNAEGKGY